MKKLQFNTLIITIAIVFTTSFQGILYGQSNQDDAAIALKAEEYIKKIQKDWKIPGLSVSISKGGKVVYAKGFGVKELTNNMFSDGKNMVDENTVFQIGSISKSFTATVMAQLVDEGKIKWEDTVKNILPDFRMYDKWVEENLQVRDIMTHHTGIGGQAGTYIPNLGYGREDVYKMLPFFKPTYGFRGGYEYNNITFIIASKIIEKLTEKSWEDNIRERILIPLGMTSTSINKEGFNASKNVAVPHEFYYSKGRMLTDSTWTDSLVVNPLYGDEQALHWLTVIGPAGGINSTAVDMAKYAQFHLDLGRVGDKQIISRKQMQYLHKGQTITSQDSSRTTLYGHCWFVEQNSRYRLYFHTGTTWGFTAICAFVPEQNLSIVMLANSEVPSSPRYALMRRVIDYYKGFPEKDYSASYLASFMKEERDSERVKWEKLKSEELKVKSGEVNSGEVNSEELKVNSEELKVKSDKLKSEELAGVYDKGEPFGKAVVTMEGDDLYITIGTEGWKHKMKRLSGDKFSFRSDGHGFDLKFVLKEGRRGKVKVSGLDIDFGYDENFGIWKKIK